MAFTVDRCAWHFTDGANLDLIAADGMLLADAHARPARSVGNPRIKAKRARRGVDAHPGGVVADYVPFYFAPRRPMFVSVVDQRAAGWEDRQRRLIYLVTSPRRVMADGHSVVYADRNAVLELAKFEVDGAACPIDWALIDSVEWMWITAQDDWKARCQAEMLVYRDVPLSAIEVIGVADDAVAGRVAAILAEAGVTIPTQVHRDWYL